MNSFKTLVIVALLGAIGVGLYLKVQSMPEPKPPADFSGEFGTPPMVEMEAASNELTAGMAAPSSVPVSPGGMAPTFNPADGGGSAPSFMPAPAKSTEPINVSPESHGNAPRYGASTSPSSTASQPAIRPSLPALPTGVPTPPAEQADPFVVDSQRNAPQRPVETKVPDRVPPKSRRKHATFEQAWTAAREMLDRNDLAGAHLLLSQWYAHTSLTPREQHELSVILGQLAGTVIYSTEHHLEPAYRIQVGDTLATIAEQYDVTPELLAKINGIDDPVRLLPGREIKVVRGPFAAVVNASTGEMTLVLGGRYAGKFPLQIGADAANAQGQYEVKEKKPAATYYGPTQTVPPGHRDNPVGAHWMSLVKPLNNSAAGPLGIHAINPEAGAGVYDSRGFLRLGPADAAEAYDILSIGSTVIIRR